MTDNRKLFAIEMQQLITNHSKKNDLTKGDILCVLELVSFDLKYSIRESGLDIVSQEENIERGMM